MINFFNYKNNISVEMFCCRVLIYILFGIFLKTPAVFSQEQIGRKDIDHFDGEILTFNMKFSGFSTATSKFYTELNDPRYFGINWDLRSKTIYKLLFNVNNHYFTLIDLNNRLPVKQYKKIEQKNINQSFETVFDREKSIAKTDNGLQWPITKNCMDLLSMLYHIRSIDLAPGDSLSYTLDIESHIWRISGLVREGDKIDGPFQELITRQIVFSFAPELPVLKRKWKTDLLTNRISRPDTRLTISLGPRPESLPIYLKFETSDTSVEMLLENYFLEK